MLPSPPDAETNWQAALAAARARDWDAVSALAEAGLAAPGSEEEALRLAFLHCLSGSYEEAEHVLAQAVQTVSGEDLPRRFAAWLEREGMGEAARRFR